MITKDLLKTWKSANESIVVWINGETATMGFNSKVAVKGFESTTVHAEFNGFKARLPNGYKKACASQSIYKWQGENGNFAALRMLIRVGDELTFHVTDNQNGYLKAATIPSENLRNDYDGGFRHPDYYGIHADTLYVDITRNGKRILSDFILEFSNCPNNSARMLGN